MARETWRTVPPRVQEVVSEEEEENDAPDGGVVVGRNVPVGDGVDAVGRAVAAAAAGSNAGTNGVEVEGENGKPEAMDVEFVPDSQEQEQLLVMSLPSIGTAAAAEARAAAAVASAASIAAVAVMGSGSSASGSCDSVLLTAESLSPPRQQQSLGVSSSEDEGPIFALDAVGRPK
jgi:hypothetical protein